MSDAERYWKIKRIAEQAVELDDAARASFLDAICTGDANLRSAVDDLIAQYFAPTARLGSLREDEAPRSAPRAGALLEPGSLVQQRYAVAGILGAGSAGTVYRAYDRRLKSPVALKQAVLEDPSSAAAFAHEAKLLRRLKHRRLPRVIDYFDEAGAWYIVMDFVPGVDLSDALGERGRPFDVGDVVLWGEQILDVLVYLHAFDPPILHRDIKPQNIRRTPDGEIVVVDFGLSKGRAADMSRHADDGSVMGFTPHFAPLEQIARRGTDPRSDIYALGATLYYLSTGERPADAMARALALTTGLPDPLAFGARLPRALPPQLESLIRIAMSQDPAARPRSAAEMQERLRGIARSLGP